MTLYDEQENPIHDFYDTGHLNVFGADKSVSGVRWKFSTPSADGDYRVIAYAGVPGKCKGVGVSFVDVKVS